MSSHNNNKMINKNKSRSVYGISSNFLIIGCFLNKVFPYPLARHWFYTKCRISSFILPQLCSCETMNPLLTPLHHCRPSPDNPHINNAKASSAAAKSCNCVSKLAQHFWNFNAFNTDRLATLFPRLSSSNKFLKFHSRCHCSCGDTDSFSLKVIHRNNRNCNTCLFLVTLHLVHVSEAGSSLILSNRSLNFLRQNLACNML